MVRQRGRKRSQFYKNRLHKPKISLQISSRQQTKSEKRKKELQKLTFKIDFSLPYIQSCIFDDDERQKQVEGHEACGEKTPRDGDKGGGIHQCKFSRADFLKL